MEHMSGISAIGQYNSHFNGAETAMSPEQARRTQRPYRYGMILLCFGALINWVGLAENYTEPIRYAGVACIICGALLICTAMCCWLHTPQQNTFGATEGENSIHVINISEQLRNEKPPEYETCMAPPCYDDAIQLCPDRFLPSASGSKDLEKNCTVAATGNALKRPQEITLTVVTVCATPAPSIDVQNSQDSIPVVR